MSREMALVFLIATLAWMVAITVKAAKAFIGGHGYRFGRWDGGQMFAGNTLTPTGTRIKLVVTSVLVFGVIGLLTGLLPMREGGWGMIGVLAVSVVSDRLTTER